MLTPSNSETRTFSYPGLRHPNEPSRWANRDSSQRAAEVASVVAEAASAVTEAAEAASADVAATEAASVVAEALLVAEAALAHQEAGTEAPLIELAELY